MPFDYSDLFDQQATTAQATAVGAAMANPEQAAKSIQLGTQNGIAPAVIDTDPSSYEEIFKQQKAGSAVAGDPALQRYVNGDPMAAKVSADDWDNMGFFAKAASALGTGFLETGPLEAQLGRAGTQLFLNKNVAGDVAATQAQIDALSARLKTVHQFSGFSGFLQSLGSLGGMVADSFTKATGPAAIGGAVVGGPAGATFAGTAAGVLDFARIGFGQTYVSLSGERDAQGRALPESTKFWASTVMGVANGALAAIGGGAIANETKAMVSNIFQRGITEAAKNPSVQRAIASAAGQLGAKGLEGAAMGASLQFLSTYATQFAKISSGLDFQTVLNNGEEITNAIKEIAQAAVVGAAAFSSIHLPGIGRNALMDSVRIHQAQSDALNLDSAVNAAAATKTAQRSPEMFAQFAAQQFGDRAVYIAPDRIPEIYGEMALDDPKGPLAFVPDLQKQVDAGLATGTAIEVPLAQLVARASQDPEMWAALRDHVRNDPDSLSVMEAQELEAGPGEVAQEPSKPPAGENEPAPASKPLEITITKPTIEAPPTVPMEPIDVASAPDVAEVTVHTAVENDRQALYLEPIFKQPEDLGLQADEYRRYSRLLEEFQAQVNAKATESARREVSRRQTNWWKDNELAIRGEVETEFNNDPVQQAAELLRTGKMLTDPEAPTIDLKLDRAQVEALLDPYGINEGSAWKGLPKGSTRRGGTDVEEAASVLGFGSAKEMLTGLQRFERDRGDLGPAAYRKTQIEAEVARRMEEKFGFLDGNIQAEVDSLVVNKAQSDLLDFEMRALAKAGGFAEPIEKADLEAFLHEDFQAQPLDRGRAVNKWRRAVADAGRQAELALLKQDYAKAFAAKQRQFKALIQAQSAEALARDVKRVEATIKRVQKAKVLKWLPQEFTDQLHQILEKLGFPTARNRQELHEALAGQSFEGFLADRAAQGEEIAAAPWLGDGRIKYADLTVEQFRALQDTLASMIHVGRQAKSIEVLGKRAELTEVEDQIVEQLKGFGPRFTSTAPETAEGLKSGFISFERSITRMQTLLDRMDRDDPLGIFNSSIIRKLEAAKHARTALRNEVKARLDAIPTTEAWRKGLDQTVPNDTLLDPISGEPMVMDRRTLITLMLNMGSKVNRQKLVEGMNREVNGKRVEWGETQVENFIRQHATKEDVAYVNAVWKFFEWFRTEHADPMQRRVSGVAADPRPPKDWWVSQEAGKLEGGYFPLFENKKLGSVAELSREKAVFADNYFRASTPKSYTKQVTDALYPVELHGTFSLLAHKIDEMVHDVTFREPVRDVAKVIYSRRVREAIKATFGPETSAMFDPWLKDVANSVTHTTQDMAFIDRAALRVRRALVDATLAGNLRVLFSPNPGRFFSPSRLALASKLLRDPAVYAQERDFALANSPELQEHTNQADIHIRETLGKAIGDGPTLRTQWARVLFEVGGKIEQYFRVLAWMDEYKKAAESGMTDADAFYTADKAVRQEFGGGRDPMDTAAFFRGSERWKLMAGLFGGYMNTMYNNARPIVTGFKDGVVKVQNGDNVGARRDFGKVMANTLHWIVIQGILNYLIYGTANKDEPAKGLAKGIAAQIFGMVPILNTIGANLIQGYDFKISPFESIIQNTLKAIPDIEKELAGKNPSGKWLQHLIETPGYALGVPGTHQAAMTTQYLWDLHAGKAQGQTFGQWWRGFTTGSEKVQNR